VKTRGQSRLPICATSLAGPLHAQVETFARKNPVLMIFEDAHWADPTSLELFGQGVNWIANLPVLLVITFRPEFEPPWIGLPNVTALTLNRLTRPEVDAMIDSVAGNKSISANIRHEIIERTDGMPLFVEEMTKAVLEAESQRAAECVAAAIPSSAVAVPATLHASLMARLDRLGCWALRRPVSAPRGSAFRLRWPAPEKRRNRSDHRRPPDPSMAAGSAIHEARLPPPPPTSPAAGETQN
jgi:hypothetical protein